MKEVNARIKSTHLGYEDHGILTAMVVLDLGSGQQGFGGYRLDGPDGKPHSSCGAFVACVLKAVGVEAWEKLPGSPCRVREEGGRLVAIGHFMDERWYALGTGL